MTTQTKQQITNLIETAATVYVSSIDENGYPNVKAMFPCPRESLAVHYFSTNVSSRRHTQFTTNPKASIYFCDPETFLAVMLRGEMNILTDHETKARFWTEGDEKYYPGGIDDPDYCIYCFTAIDGRYYSNLSSGDFEISELN